MALLCSGIRTKDLRFGMSGNRFAATVVREDPRGARVEEYCDSDENELRYIHPKLLKENEELMKDLTERLDKIKHLDKINGLLKRFWTMDFVDRIMNFDDQVISFLTSYYTLSYPYQDMCRETHPDIHPFLCAMEYFYSRKFSTYDDFEVVFDEILKRVDVEEFVGPEPTG